MAKKPKSKRLLTNKRANWVKNRKTTLRGKPLNYSYAAQEKYQGKLEKLIRKMVSETNTEIVRLFDTKHANQFFGLDAENITPQARILTNSLMARFQQLFDKNANGLAQGMVDDADSSSKGQLHASLKQLSGGLSLKTSSITPAMKQIMAASVAENVSLIKSIPSQYFTQIQGSVMRSITNGNGLQDLVPALKKHEGVTFRRARTIARDQTRKAFNNLNAGRMEKLGIEEYTWLHSGGAIHPRPDHVAMSGNVYRLDKPPIIDPKTGQRGKPGDLINCGCKMIPVIRFDNSPSPDEDDEDGQNSEV